MDKIDNGVRNTENKLNACIKDDSDNCYTIKKSREGDCGMLGVWAGKCRVLKRPY